MGNVRVAWARHVLVAEGKSLFGEHGFEIAGVDMTKSPPTVRVFAIEYSDETLGSYILLSFH